MARALRESLEAIVADWSRILAEAVARARGFDLEQAASLIKSGFISAQSALSSRLVDRVGYLKDLVTELNPHGDGRDTVDLARYLRHLGMKRSSSRGGRVAVGSRGGSGLRG